MGTLGRPDDKLREAIQGPLPNPPPQAGEGKVGDCFVAPSERLAMTVLMRLE